MILETLRMQTPLGILVRTCTRDYTLPGTQIHLRWGLKKVFNYTNKNELIRSFVKNERYKKPKIFHRCKTSNKLQLYT